MRQNAQIILTRRIAGIYIGDHRTCECVHFFSEKNVDDLFRRLLDNEHFYASDNADSSVISRPYVPTKPFFRKKIHLVDDWGNAPRLRP